MIAILDLIFSKEIRLVRSEAYLNEKQQVVTCDGNGCFRRRTLMLRIQSEAETASTVDITGQPRTIAVRAEPILLSAEPVRFSLQLSASYTGEKKALASYMDTLSTKQRMYLVLTDLYAREQPGILYRLFLDLPEDAELKSQDTHYVGTLNFFNAVRPEGERLPLKKPNIFRSYDITTLVRNLREKNLLQEVTTLTIYPVGVPAPDAQPSIGRVELVEQ